MINARTRHMVLLICLFISGCAAVSSPRLTAINRATSTNTLTGAANYVAELKRELETKQSYQDQFGASARFGTLGGTLGATAAALYKAHRDTVLGFGLLGAGSYAAGNLYTPTAYSEIYESALSAANCVDSFAAPAAAMMPLIERHQKTLENAMERLFSLSSAGTSRETDIRNTLAAGRQTLQRAADYLAREPLLATHVVQAVDEIIQITNKQLRLNTPNLEAFASAGRSIFAAATNIPGTTQPLPDTKIARGPPQAVQPEALETAIKAVSDNDRTLKAQLDAFDKVGDPQTSNCSQRAKLATSKPLEVSPADVVLAENQPFNIHVSGGTPPYDAFWIGAQPPSDTFDAGRIPFSTNVFRISTKKPFTGSYVYRIVDNEKMFRDITVHSAKLAGGSGTPPTPISSPNSNGAPDQSRHRIKRSARK